MASWSVGLWIRNILLGLVVLAFVVVFGQSSGSGGASGAVAEVNGERVEREVFEHFRRGVEARERQRLPEDASAADLRDVIDEQTRSSLIYRCILSQEARALGLTVGDEELAAELAADPSWQREGRFDRARFETYSSEVFGSRTGLAEEIRRDLLIGKFQRLLTEPIRVSEAAAMEQIRQSQTTVRLRYSRARASDFRDSVSVSDEEVAKLVEEDLGRIQAEFSRRSDEFNQPERIRARHILFSGDEALERAEQALARLNAGEDFVRLATQLSEDEATRDQGGDLGEFPRGRMLPDFEAAAFAADARSVAGPVKTERGIHLIRVEEKLPAVSRSLEEVSPQIARDLLLEKGAVTAARAAAEQMLAALGADESFAQAAAGAGLKVEETSPFRRTTMLIPGLGRVAGLREAAFRLSEAAPHGNRVFGAQGAFYVISLAERDEPDPGALVPQIAQTRQQLAEALRVQAVSQWYAQRYQELRSGGDVVLYDLYPGR
jgi:peptidyl-prolyl cis-trans isomerase D